MRRSWATCSSPLCAPAPEDAPDARPHRRRNAEVPRKRTPPGLLLTLGPAWRRVACRPEGRAAFPAWTNREAAPALRGWLLGRISTLAGEVPPPVTAHSRRGFRRAVRWPPPSPCARRRQPVATRRGL